MKNPTNADLRDEIDKLRLELIRRDEDLADKIDRTYLRIQIFEAEIQPLKKFVYGLISIAGAALVTAILGLVLVK